MRRRQDGKRRSRCDHVMKDVMNASLHMTTMGTNPGTSSALPTGKKTSPKDPQMRDQVTGQICPRNPSMMMVATHVDSCMMPAAPLNPKAHE